MIYGYCRVSSRGQLENNSLDLQEREILNRYENAVIYKEQISGIKSERPVFNEILNKLKKGDTLVTFDIDAIKAAGYDVITPVIITNSNNYVDVIETEQKEVNALDCLLKVFK